MDLMAQATTEELGRPTRTDTPFDTAIMELRQSIARLIDEKDVTVETAGVNR